MASAFLLRFQECCLPAETPPTCGTRTETKTYGENGDADPRVFDNAALPGQDVSRGRPTKTSMRGERVPTAQRL